MKINWHPNPFRTSVEIDDRDKQMILLAIQNEEYVDILCSLDLWMEGKIKKDTPPTMEDIQKQTSRWGEICNMTVDSEEVRYYVSYLDTEHMGDCTCVPCSCVRCHVEEMLNINTIKGLGKHQAHKVLGAFGRDGTNTIDEAIESLEQNPEYKKPDSWPDSIGYDVHIPRWEKERESALKWLKAYKKEHNF